ncbi:MAG TPA: 4Fe-4S dicluster domain-containing protein [Longimicrobiales bacterium]|nr:4Fe-4S dicluster domain-containing protein [Longimicrobiales bacterium]
MSHRLDSPFSPDPSERDGAGPREMTFEDVLRWQGMSAIAGRRLEDLGRAEGEAVEPASREGCRAGEGSCAGRPPEVPAPPSTTDPPSTVLDKPMSRRGALGTLLGALAAGSQAACSNVLPTSDEDRERLLLEFQERLKGNFRLMSDDEKQATIQRLERLAHLKRNVHVNLSGADAEEGVLFGYAFNLSKCKGYRECVAGCLAENNQDRRSGIQYIRIFEMEGGEINLEHATAEYQHEVPQEGRVYLGTQCFQCANPPCVEVCPVAATWQEPDGIVVIDYDWCIGCRYCIAACPYWARRFNWSEPVVPAEDFNPNQHYLGNRKRRKGCVEKCTFCIQRTRVGRLPACAEACPTGARVFGNLLDPDSEIRWILEHKRVFRLKAELGTEPRFWYYMD